jgi:hypothetical protein
MSYKTYAWHSVGYLSGLELGGDLGKEVALGSATSSETNFKAILKSSNFLMICHTYLRR